MSASDISPFDGALLMQWLILLAGLLALLTVASIVASGLKRRAQASSALIDNLNARIKTWWIMVLVISAAFLLGKAGLIILFAFVSLTALREFLTLTRSQYADHKAMIAAFYIVLPTQYALIWIEWYGLYSIFIPIYVALFLPIITACQGDTGRFVERIAELQWAVMACVFCLSHVPALTTLGIPGFEGRNLLLVAFLLLVVQLSDVLQYSWGKLIGRHAIAPKLSPSKTWEGFFGGVASASMIGAGLWWITPFTPFQAGIMALIATVMGFLGGLVMSAIKRERGIKDWGLLIEGHGGMLDRADSLIFAAPIFFHLVRYWWVP